MMTFIPGVQNVREEGRIIHWKKDDSMILKEKQFNEVT